MSGEPVLLVVYDQGSLSPTRIVAAARQNRCRPVFVVPDTAHVRDMAPVLGMLAQVVPVSDDRARLLRMMRELAPKGIATFSETMIGIAAWLAAELGLRYHELADLRAITHKDAQRLRLADRGVGTVRFRAVADPAAIDEAVAYVDAPAIVKPVVGAASRNTVLAATRSQARAELARLLKGGGTGLVEDAVILEEFLVGRPTLPPWGDYIAVDCVASGGDVQPLFTTSKFALAEPFRERGGYGSRTVLPSSEIRAVQDLACQALRALGIRLGVADVEIKLTAGGPRIIEVNGRLGAWVDDIAVRSGTADPAGAAIRCALGQDPGLAVPRDDGPIAFHYLVLPPVRATRIRAVRDADALRRIRHVSRVSVLGRPGDEVDWRLGTRTVASVQGVVSDHQELADVVREIEHAEWISYDQASPNADVEPGVMR